LIKSIKLDYDLDLYDITIQENKIYVCGDRCIRVYSLDLDEISMHYFEDMPMQIRISTNMACIKFKRKNENNEFTRFTRFHKLPSFELVIEHDLNGPILAHNNLFYLYHQKSTGFTVFDKNGKIMKEIERDLGEIDEYICV
jgi:hypothetical protein